MSILQEIRADALRRSNEAKARDRIVQLLAYVEDNLKAHAVPHGLEWTADDQVVITLDLKPVEQVEKAPVPLELPAPEFAARAKPSGDARVSPKKQVKRSVPPAKRGKIRLEKGKPPVYRTGKYDDEELAVFTRMAAEGRGSGDIAKALGRNQNAVGVKLYWHLKHEAEAAAKSAPLVPDVPIDEPSATPVAAVVPSPKSTAPRGAVAVPVDEVVSYAERKLNTYLNSLGYSDPWDAAKDHRLVSGLLAGRKMLDVSSALQVGVDEARQRWRQLMREPGDLDFQALLVRVLGKRAGTV